MSTRKTKIEINYILNFLKENFSPEIQKIEPLKGGEMSQAFAFRHENKELVIKVDSYSYSYLKDKYAYESFANKNLPIPRVLKVGKLDERLYFSILEKIEGVLLADMTKDEIISAMPSIISTLIEIHNADISKTKGYGYWNPEGIAEHHSWNKYLVSQINGLDEWKSKYKFDFLDKDIFEHIYSKMLTYVDYCPEERFLVNGDYGFTNLIIKNNQVGGVLDWGESRFGDFVFDIAWLDMWQDSIKYQDYFLDYYKSIGQKISSLNERIACYKLHNSYGTLIFYVESNQIEEAVKLQERVRKMLV